MEASKVASAAHRRNVIRGAIRRASSITRAAVAISIAPTFALLFVAVVLYRLLLARAFKVFLKLARYVPFGVAPAHSNDSDGAHGEIPHKRSASPCASPAPNATRPSHDGGDISAEFDRRLACAFVFTHELLSWPLCVLLGILQSVLELLQEITQTVDIGLETSPMNAAGAHQAPQVIARRHSTGSLGSTAPARPFARRLSLPDIRKIANGCQELFGRLRRRSVSRKASVSSQSSARAILRAIFFKGAGAESATPSSTLSPSSSATSMPSSLQTVSSGAIEWAPSLSTMPVEDAVHAVALIAALPYGPSESATVVKQARAALKPLFKAAAISMPRKPARRPWSVTKGSFPLSDAKSIARLPLEAVLARDEPSLAKCVTSFARHTAVPRGYRASDEGSPRRRASWEASAVVDMAAVGGLAAKGVADMFKSLLGRIHGGLLTADLSPSFCAVNDLQGEEQGEALSLLAALLPATHAAVLHALLAFLDGARTQPEFNGMDLTAAFVPDLFGAKVCAVARQADLAAVVRAMIWNRAALAEAPGELLALSRTRHARRQPASGRLARIVRAALHGVLTVPSRAQTYVIGYGNNGEAVIAEMPALA